jgi:copper oxidase (laccase) domain-containing protein
MQQEFGTKASDLHAYILPAIGVDSYQVSEEVAAKFEGHYRERDDGFYLSLVSVIEAELLKAGLERENLYISDFCTFLDNDKFFSHRKGDKGRNLNFVYLK